MDFYQTIRNFLTGQLHPDTKRNRNTINQNKKELVEFKTITRSKERKRENMSFKGKNAVVTGGASGIGLQVVKELLAKEAEV